MLKHAKGNLIDMAEAGLFDVIVHGCNCHNTMGSGIAREIRERYPEAYSIDTAYHKSLSLDFDYQGSEIEKLGTYSVADAEKFKIINAYTQVGFLPRGNDHFEYESFHLILRKLAAAYPKDRIGFPRIGQGLAGGNPIRINKMLEDFAIKVSEFGGSVTMVEFG